ncbi:MAG: response regulator [Candidatus Lokiarchaeota archaeon]|nr:response regulator [Candidatus Lokiarchaeota archaeon]
MPEDTKNKWERFVDENEFTTISMLIRKAVNFYIDSKSKISLINNISKFTHDLKEPLTSIKGFSQLILENESDKLTPNILLRIKEIFAQSVFLENKINFIINEFKPESQTYDILIVEDDTSTIMVLTDFFDLKGFSTIGVTTGNKGLEELKRITPKLILLDIILPDISGYEVCKKIKSLDNFKNTPIFYISAIPESEVSEKLKETGAKGFLRKPFNFPDFKILFDYLN